MALFRKKKKDKTAPAGGGGIDASSGLDDEILDPLGGMSDEALDPLGGMSDETPEPPPAKPAPSPPPAAQVPSAPAQPVPSAPKVASPTRASEAAVRLGGPNAAAPGVNDDEAAGKFGQDETLSIDGEAAGAVGRELAFTGLANEEDMIEAIAASIGMERVTLHDLHPPRELLQEISPKVAREYKIFPLESDATSLTVAVSDPLDIRITDELRFKLGKDVISKLASDIEIEQAIARHYRADHVDSIIKNTIDDEEQRVSDEEASGAYDDEDDEDAMSGVIDLDTLDDGDQPPVVQFVNLLFREAIHQRASDIHVEPTKFSTCIRLRIDGVLQELPSPPKKWERMIISRLKVMSGMDLAEKRIPQDGRIQLNNQGASLDLRVSCLPSIHGESIVMRILDQSSIMLGLEDVGFLPDNVKRFERLIRSPNGVILMTGPTGSGKTTTLYAALNVLNSPEVKLVTIEEPVEYQVQGINQIPVNHDVGLNFSAALRSVLRQSPDIIMVGEIRDQETAEAATGAALTGHLVFSTLHTNDAPSACARLTDIGVAPFIVASAVQAVIAQRLIRRVCSGCTTHYTAEAAEIEMVGVEASEYLSRQFVKGAGCERCAHTGYRGRTAIHEVFEMNAELRQMVIRREPAIRLKNTAVRLGMRSLRMDGWEKVLLDHTSIEEIMRITALD